MTEDAHIQVAQELFDRLERSESTVNEALASFASLADKIGELQSQIAEIDDLRQAHIEQIYEDMAACYEFIRVMARTVGFPTTTIDGKYDA